MISNDKLKFGIELGYKLARLESIWGTSFGFAKKAFETAKNEINTTILVDKLIADNTDYQSYSSSIMRHYKKIDCEKYYSIIIGLVIQKSQLIGVLPNKVRNDEITASAKKYLEEIPSNVIDDKNVFFEFIKSSKKQDFILDNFIPKVEDYLKKSTTGSKKKPTPPPVVEVEEVYEPNPDIVNESVDNDQQSYTNGPTKYVFISYSSINKEFAEDARNLLIQEKISNWMAPYDIPAGARYAHVINDAIEKCSCVLLILTKEAQASVFVEREIERAVSYRKPVISIHLDNSELNSGFKYYIGSEQIVRAKAIDRNSYEMKKILDGINHIIGK